MTSPSLDALVGTTLSKTYRLISLIGAGGMGYVYRAEHLPLGRMVAVKLLKPELLNNGEDWFRTEALAASRINHPHALAIYDVGLTEEGIPFLIMEMLQGPTLADLLDGGPIDTPRAVTIGAQILSALAEAHSCGVVHCDLSADNIIIEQVRSGEDFAKVIDFGLARLVDSKPGQAKLVGTPEYMAPEQLQGAPLGPAADLYAVGVLLYEMLVGRTPFAGSSARVILDGHLHANPIAPHELIDSCSEDLGALVLWALSKRPEDRPRGAREMRDALLGVFDRDRAAPQCSACQERATWDDRFCSSCGAIMGTQASVAPRLLARGSDPNQRRRSSRVTGEFERPSSRAPLIGRDQELRRLIEFCRGGTHEHTFGLIGPSGVGKARLICEAARSLGRQVPFFVSGPDPSGARSPWYPILSVLEHVLDLPETVDLENLSQAVTHMGLPDRDVPGLAELFSVPGPLQVLEHAVRRREAQASALRVLLSIRRRFPRAVIGFADVDEYDQPSRRLISTLVDQAADSGVRVVLTAEHGEDLPIGAVLLELGPLTPESTGQLARQLVGERASVPDDDALYELTRGAPVAVEQLAGWLELGNRAAGAPTILVDLVSSRLSRMPAGSRLILQAVAVHGTSVPRWMVEATLGGEAALAAAGSGFTGLLEIDEQRVAITSELVREVILACTPADVRRNLHRLALAALDGKASHGVVGYHAEHIGNYNRAYAAYLASGKDAIERFDDRGGAEWFERARVVAHASVDQGDPSAADRLVEASIMLADALRFTGRIALATAALDEAELHASKREQQARMIGARGRVALSANDTHEGLDLLKLAVGAAVRLGDRELMCASYIELARSLDRVGHARESQRELEQALDILTMGTGMPATDAPADLWYLGLMLAEGQLKSKQCTAARFTAEHALEQARFDHSARGRARLSALLAEICRRSREDSLALRHRDNALQEMRTLGDRRSTAELLIESAAPSVGEIAQMLPIANTRRDLRTAGRLAKEVGWYDGIMLSRQSENDEETDV